MRHFLLAPAFVLISHLTASTCAAGFEFAGDEVASQVARHALVIGIERYGGGYSRLCCPVRDARAVANVLAAMGYRVTLLTDDAEPVDDHEQQCASRRGTCPDVDQLDAGVTRVARSRLDSDTVARTIKEFFVRDGADASAELFLWYAGHGETVGAEGFLVGADAERPSEAAAREAFFLRSLPIRDVGSMSRLAKSRRFLGVFDSCFGGTIFESRLEPRPALSTTQMRSLPVRQFISAGGPGEEVVDDGWFRKAFVCALRGETKAANANGDNHLTGSELGLFLAMVAEGRKPQTPQSGVMLDRDYDRGNFSFEVVGDPPAEASDSACRELGSRRPVAEPRVTDGRWWQLPFRDGCPGCPQVVAIPRDCVGGEPGTPRFALGVYEVTADEWAACVADGACAGGRGQERDPVAAVTTVDVVGYLDWLSRKTGKRYRLPTVEEWRCAAGAGATGPFWFGPAADGGVLRCRGCDERVPVGPLPVGSFGMAGRNPSGLFDVHGNVWEIVVDDHGAHRVIGGSWANPATFAELDLDPLPALEAGARSAAVGFRVLREMGR